MISAIIPARGGSKGIPNKNIVDFCGMPLLAYSIQQAKQSSLIDDVYVSSDSEKILDVAQDFGAIGIKRPIDISGDTASSESALLQCIQSIPKKYDTTVFLQATSPLRTSHNIEDCIKNFQRNKLDSLFSAVLAEDTCLWSTKPQLNSLTYDYKKRKRRQDFDINIIENGSIYVFDTDKFTFNLNRLFGKMSYELMPKWSVHEIDNIEDLKICSLLMKEFIL
jgi:CMP-N,N'-diacetyllegionaminic acid synthase